MYYRYFGLDGPPFAITPDPRFVFFSERHQEALAHLLYGVGRGGGGGFVQLTGEVGTGKTTLCRLLLDELGEGVQPALILNPVLGPRELIAAVCDELGVGYPKRATRKQLVDLLNAHLLDVHARGGTVVLIIDEAQNLSAQSLEQIRLLTNLETASAKLLQIILIGQPELRELLDRPSLRQLAQRVTARYHLEPLQRDETAAYVRHRLSVGGAARCPFGEAALDELHRRAGGVPRLVNVIADRALLAAYTQRRDGIGRAQVGRAADEVLGGPVPRRPRFRAAAAAAGLAVVLLAAGWLYRNYRAAPADPTAPAALPTSGPENAWHDLAAWWQAELPEGAWGCDAAGAAGLACLRAEGGWEELRALAVPMLLELDDGGSWLVAREADASALLTLNGTARVPRDSVSRRWRGGYVILLRLPDSVPGTLSPGDRGEGVAWLRRRANELHAGLEGGEPVYDDHLRAWVERFQASAGLPATGIADAATLVVVAARSAGRES